MRYWLNMFSLFLCFLEVGVELFKHQIPKHYRYTGEVIRSYTPISVTLFIIHLRLKPFFFSYRCCSQVLSLLEDASNSQIFMWNSAGLSHAICVFLPGFQFLESIIVSLCWASGMAVAKLNIRVFKNIFHHRDREVGSMAISSLVQFNPLHVPFSPVWVSAASCKMRNNTDP